MIHPSRSQFGDTSTRAIHLSRSQIGSLHLHQLMFSEKLELCSCIGQSLVSERLETCICLGHFSVHLKRPWFYLGVHLPRFFVWTCGMQICALKQRPTEER